MAASQITVRITQALPFRVHEGKTAVITGGSRNKISSTFLFPTASDANRISEGLGASIAQNLASKGANVILIYLNDSSGRIVHVSSVGSKVGLEYLTLYGGSKGALEAMTRTWARELKENCTVNSCNPSSTTTDMLRGDSHDAKKAISMWYPLTPLCGIREWDSDEQKEMAEQYGGRAGYAEEITGIVGMICSPESAWMTGCLVSANGGQ